MTKIRIQAILIIWAWALLCLLPCYSFPTSDSCDVAVGFSDSRGIVSLPIKGDRVSSMDGPTTGPPLREPDMVWVEDTLASMTLDEKIGQLIMPEVTGSAKTNINTYKVGGFIFTGNNRIASDLIATTNDLQNYAPLPLFFAIDAEAGLGARVADATIFPLIMAFGAANDPSLTEDCGRITARETRSLGIHIAFGPVVDVNTEPLNPIISTRAYSDETTRVTSLARGFLKGARREGLLCTFKHYPGHGATTGDSHSSLPTVDLPYPELRAVHIEPYAKLAGTGDIDLVMTAHVWYSAVDTEKPWPATLSSIFLLDILRGDINYNGIIISDAYGMSGLAIAVPDEGERAVVGIEAGLDIILMPPSVGNAFTGIKNAALSERITQERINESVRRILIAKSRAGLPEMEQVDPDAYTSILHHPDHVAKVREVCERAFTCGKNNLAPRPPLNPEDHILVLTLASSRTIFYLKPSAFFTDPLSAAVPNTQIQPVPKNIDTSLHDTIIALAQGVDKVVVAGYDWYKILSNDQVALINELAEEHTVIYVSFGAPYHYLQIPGVSAFYCGYASTEQMQEVAVEVLVGERKPLGDPPVSLEDFSCIYGITEWLLR